MELHNIADDININISWHIALPVGLLTVAVVIATNSQHISNEQ